MYRIKDILDKSFVIYPDHILVLGPPKNDAEHYSLEEIQSMVTGYVENIPCVVSKDHVCYVNEEGMLLNLPYNPIASDLLGTALVGPVALIRKENTEC